MDPQGSDRLLLVLVGLTSPDLKSTPNPLQQHPQNTLATPLPMTLLRPSGLEVPFELGELFITEEAHAHHELLVFQRPARAQVRHMGLGEGLPGQHHTAKLITYNMNQTAVVLFG